MADDRRRDGSKPTFAERDKRRRERSDRSDHGGGRGGRRGQAHAQKAYRAALERAFESGTVDELAATLTRVRAPQVPVAPAAPLAAAEPASPTDSTPTKPDGKRPTGKPAPSKRSQLVAKIRGAEGSREITEAVDRFLAEFPELPNDYEVLEKALGHKKGDVVSRALQQLEVAIARAKPRRSRSLLLKLTLLEENHEDEDICAHAGRVRASL